MLETLRVLAYIVDTGHTPPSALMECAQMEAGRRFPYQIPTLLVARRALACLPPSHAFYRPEIK